MKHKVLIVVMSLLALVLTACGGRVPEVDWTLNISGAVNNPLVLSFDELVELPQSELEGLLMEKSLGEDTTGDWSGVALTDILNKAGVGEYVSITVVAGDGYAIEISKDELEGAIVALKENGKWIADADPDHGPIRLVCPHTPANRWIFQLKDLQVNTEAAGVPDDADFRITGNVKTEVGWTEGKLQSMDTIDTEYTDKNGDTKTYTGVRISDLLSKADPEDGATTVTLVADDGFSTDVPLEEIEACASCIVSFQNQGGFRIVAPDFSGKAQVKGVVEIQVQ